MSLSTGVLGLAMGAASTVTSTYAAHQQAEADNRAAQWNASAMENNAALLDIKAEQTLEQGKHAVAQAKIEGDQLIETQRATYAASGVKVDSGSALDVVAQQAGFNKYEQDMIQHNYDLEAWGIRSEAASTRQQAAMTRATKRSPTLAAASTLLSGGTSMYNQYNQYRMFDK